MGLEKIREGTLLSVDKPREWTSFDVVNKIRRSLKIKKVGHAGTLDPLATGLLLIGTGNHTKKLNELQGLDKVYTGIIELGKTTPSYDLETAFDSETSTGHLQLSDIHEAVNKLTGNIVQFPPAHSAVKVKGTRAYKLARQNEKVEIKSRDVTVYRFDIQFTAPEVHFEVHCSKGTYIRSLAHDLGQSLGVGGYLKELRRTKIGDYSVEQAYTLEKLITTWSHEGN